MAKKSHTPDLTQFQSFWLGYNTARKDSAQSAILYGEARIVWEQAIEAAAEQHQQDLEG